MKTVVCINSDCTLSYDTETVSKDTIHKNLYFRLNFIIFYMNNKIVCIIVVEFCIGKTCIISKNRLVQYNKHTI